MGLTAQILVLGQNDTHLKLYLLKDGQVAIKTTHLFDTMRFR